MKRVAGLRKSCPRRFQSTISQNSVQVTTLPNKIKVASDATPSHFSTLGLYIDAGSRYETPQTAGASHFIDRLAYKSTTSRSEERMLSDAYSIGGQIMSTSARETIMYQSSQFHKATPLAMSIIADTALNPTFLDSELADQREATRYELRELSSKPEMILPELLHELAYNNVGLGNPILAPEDCIDGIDASLLQNLMKVWYRPERMVIAGMGMSHQELLELVDKNFSSMSPSSSQSSQLAARLPQPPLLSQSSAMSPRHNTRFASQLSSTSPLNPMKSPPTTYTGGHRFILDTTAEFNHVYIAFQGAGVHEEDIYALAAMQVILGGGGSFSAGGPGKGMYSRLYTQILNLFTQVNHCASFHHIYSDSSLLGLFASFTPASSGLRGGNTPSQILPHLVHQFSLLTYIEIGSEELSRAKNQLKSGLTMALESPSVMVEDLGRQILIQGKCIPMQDMLDRVDALTARDIQKVAIRYFSPQPGNRPTVLCMGHDETGDWESIFRKYGVGDV